MKRLRTTVGQSSFSSYVRHWVRSNIAAGDVVLDVGARDFPYTRDTAATKLYGIDLPSEDEPTLGWTRELLQTLSSDERIEAIIADCQELPFTSGSIDTIVCTEVLEHVPNDAAAVAEFARVLRPGGQLLLTTPNGAEVALENPHHLRHYTSEQLRNLLVERFGHVDVQTVFPNQALYRRQYETSKRSKRIFWRATYEAWWRTRGRNARGGYTLLAIARHAGGDDHTPRPAETIVVCPACKETLDRDLRCTSCGLIYRREAGLPVLNPTSDVRKEPRD